MTTAAVVLAALLAAVLVVWVARPFLTGVGREEPEPDAAALERLRLYEDRDRALAALKELEFDHRTGKISDVDYAALVGPLRAEAVATLAALDATQPVAASADGPVSAELAPPEREEQPH
jgi:hypothetical protein